MENENKTVEVYDSEIFQDYMKGKWWLYIDYSTYKALRDKLPPYDLVEVVRCGKCKYWYPLRDVYKDGTIVEYDNGLCKRDPRYFCMDNDDYCSKAERREDNADTQ